ncbi:MAG: hypothetical protein F6J89_33445 [Symploca sp. SIO1C4]|uniref:Transposase n=1 Tax=Symploca sp. SIO1C4 TaxID=2607765 RepID=A0A6B3NKU6_9CYAN|nr:hypothetical protein [Symploca sp. SIO1C4]
MAVIAAGGCILGHSLSSSAGHDDLKAAYGVFEKEVTHLSPGYTPKTVTTDGWDATRSAWEALFPSITWILCFLHEVIKVRDLCRSQQELRHTLTEKLWHIYHATTKRQFAQRLRRVLDWTTTASLNPSIEQRLKRLTNKSLFFQRAFDFPNAYRTSNQVDRPMNYIDRTLYAMQDFHGSWQAAELSARSMALLWNFHPFCRKTRQQHGGCLCPFERLNGFRYHDDWFRNLLIASSLNGRRPLPKL